MVIAFGVAIGAYAAMNSTLRYCVMQPRFEALEDAAAEKDIARCVNALHQEIEDLHRSNSDWANWNDTYQFVQDGNQAYITSNLVWKSLQIAGIDLMCFVDAKNQVVWGQRYNPVTGEAESLQAPPLDFSSPDSPPSRLGRRPEGARGILLTQQGPMMLSVRAILKSDYTGPAAGLFIVGRRLDANVLQRIGTNVRIDFTASPVTDPAWSAAERALAGELTISQHRLVGSNPNLLMAYGVLPSVDGKPALLIRARIPREIGAKARELTSHMSATLVLAGGALVILSLAIRSAFSKMLQNGRGSTTTASYRQRILTIGAVATAGIGLSIWASLGLRDMSRRHQRNEFETEAREQMIAIQHEVKDSFASLQTLRSVCEMNTRISREQFASAARIQLQQRPGIHALEWAPRVPLEARASYEQEHRTAGEPGFVLTERDQQQNFVNAGIRPEYFPVGHVEPAGGNEVAIGFDLASEPMRRDALQNAGDTGELTATSPLTLVQEKETQGSMLVFLPVYAEHADLSTRTLRRQSLRGYVVAVSRPADMIRSGTSNLVAEGISVSVRDITDPQNPKELHTFRSGPDGITAASATEAPAPQPECRQQVEFQMAGRRWQIVCTPSPIISESDGVWLAASILGSGLFVTLLLSLYLWNLAEQHAHTEVLVRQRTAALREREQDLAVTLASIGDAVIATDAHGKVKHMNPVAETLTGYLLEEASGQLLTEVFRTIHTQTRQPAANPVEMVLRDGQTAPLSSYTSLVARDGRERQIAESAAPIRNARGEVVGVVLVFRDVTEEYRLRENVRKSEERMQLALRGGDLGLWDWNLVTGETVFNDRWAEMLGYELSEIKPHVSSWKNLVHPDDLPRTMEVLNEHLAGRTAMYSVEFRMRHKSGDMRWILDRGKVVLRGPEGQPLRATGTHLDITEAKTAEVNLRGKEQRLRAITDSAPDAILVVDDHGQITLWNPAAERIFGYTADEALGRDMRALIATETCDQQMGLAFQLSREEAAVAPADNRRELVARRKNGEEFPAELSVSAFQLDGQWHAAGILRDISERVRAEEALRDRLDRGRLQRDILARVAASPDVDMGQVDAVVKNLIELAARAIGVGRVSVWLLDEPNSKLHCADCYEAAFDRHSCGLVLEERQFLNEFAVLKSSRYVDVDDALNDPRVAGYVKDYVVPLGITAMLDVAIRTSGSTMGALCLEHVGQQHHWEHDEISFACQLADQLALTILNRKRRLAEERLAERERLLRTIIDLLPQRVFWKDRECRYLGANVAFQRDAGMSDVIGKTDLDMPWTVEAESYRDWDRRVMDSRRAQLNILETQHSEAGEEMWLSCNKVPLVSTSGEVVGVLGTYQDITSFRRTEQELERARDAADAASRAKSEFLANMSHEIRTPMTAILGYSESLVLEGDLNKAPPERLRALRAIRVNGEHLLQIINDILDLSKIEAGHLEVEHIRCSPIRILTDVQAMMASPAKAKGLNFSIEFEGKVPEFIESDPIRLRQVLLNLVGNAVRFTERGSVRIVAGLSRNQAPAHLQFLIIDTGIGMSREEMATLFQPFVQADTSTTRKYGGTGLGLSISKRMAELLGGAIEVESHTGRGSTFKVTVATGPLEGIPMLERPQEMLGGDSVQMPGASPASTHLSGRILLAEDGEDNREFIGHFLRQAGAEVDLAGNGQEAVDKALAAAHPGPGGEPARPFDCILMDMQMPVMDGYEATARLRANGYRGAIVALTAHVMVSDRKRCLQAGCDHYASKPIDRVALFGLLGKYLSTETAAARAAEPEMADLISRFLHRLPGRVQELEAALATHDLTLLREQAHKLKGAAGSYGFQEITRTAAVVEDGVRRQATAEDLQRDTRELIDLCVRACSQPPAQSV